MAKITVMSDLHLEFSYYDIRNTQKADILVLSGDILIAEDLHDFSKDAKFVDLANVGQRHRQVINYRKFLQQAKNEFEHVVAIAGNHEFYHGKWVKGLDYLRKEYLDNNIHFLECSSVGILLNTTDGVENIIFIGGTLWTDMNQRDPLTVHSIQNVMNDYHLIRHDQKNYRKLKPIDTITRHEQTLAYIKTTLDNLRQSDMTYKIVVVGHHGPTFKSVSEEYAHDTLINGAYCSDLSSFILDYPEIALWTAGHTHHAYEYYIGTTRVVCNPRGYETYSRSENTGWNPNLVIDI